MEFCDDYPKIENDAEVLILAGDVGNPYEEKYKNFLKSVSENFEKIFLITGNHEYYCHGNSIIETDKHITNIIQSERLDNVIFLNNDFYDYKNYRFVGTTLWSKITNSADNSLTSCFDLIHDFDVEKMSKTDSIKNYNKLFDKNYNFLQKTIFETESPIIAITHHLPSHQLVAPKYLGHTINQCFASSCEKLMTENVPYWFYGHTHTPGDTIIGKTRLLCNPMGYPNENIKVDKNKIITLKNLFF